MKKIIPSVIAKYGKYIPNKKVLAGGIAAAVFFVAQRLGVDLGANAVNEAANAAAGLLVAYLVPAKK